MPVAQAEAHWSQRAALCHGQPLEPKRTEVPRERLQTKPRKNRAHASLKHLVQARQFSFAWDEKPISAISILWRGVVLALSSCICQYEFAVDRGKCR